MENVEILIAIVEICLIGVIAYFGRGVWNRMRDYDCFGRIVTGNFNFSPKYYKDNRRALFSYVHAYINYGYNIRCEMTAEEFRHNITVFMKKFYAVDKHRLKTLNTLLDNICTDIRKGVKLGDEDCRLRARYLMKKIEKIYLMEISSDDEDTAEFMLEIEMLLSESTW